MGRALASPAASTADSPAAMRTPTSCRRSSEQHRIAVPPPACLNPQSEPHVVPSRRVPRASSLALARIRQRLSDCRIFTPAQPNHSVASSEGFLLRRLHPIRYVNNETDKYEMAKIMETTPEFVDLPI